MDDKEVHITVTNNDIKKFLQKGHSEPTCFRCGEYGHMKSQCHYYKVRLCIHFERGICNKRDCSFAHGEKELRDPWGVRCVKFVKDGDTTYCMGCNSTQHTFRKCPIHRNNTIFL